MARKNRRKRKNGGNRKAASRSRPTPRLAGLFRHEPPQPQDLVLIILGIYMRPAHKTVWSGGLVRLLAQMGFTAGAARIALARLVKRGLLRRVRHGRLASYALTPRSESLLDEGDRRILTLGRRMRPPDLWTTLIHQIPEKQPHRRQRLALRLRFLGFGLLQDGVWISPGDRGGEIAPLIDELDIAEHVFVLVGKRLPPSAYPLIDHLWDLRALAARYRLFADKLGPYAKASRRRDLTDADAFAIRTIMVHLFRSLAFLDPSLPDELMPDRARREAAKVFHSAYAGLARAAQRHFDSTVAAGGRQ